MICWFTPKYTHKLGKQNILYLNSKVVAGGKPQALLMRYIIEFIVPSSVSDLEFITALDINVLVKFSVLSTVLKRIGKTQIDKMHNILYCYSHLKNRSLSLRITYLPKITTRHPNSINLPILVHL